MSMTSKISSSCLEEAGPAYFIIDCSIAQIEEEDNTPQHGKVQGSWVFNVDELSNKTGSGARIVLESPEGQIFKHALRFGFHASNNVAKYEVMLLGLNLVKAIKTQKIHVKLVSQLIVE